MPKFKVFLGSGSSASPNELTKTMGVDINNPDFWRQSMKYIEGIARQPEMLPALRIQMFITAGLMESFPFIVLAFAMFFVFANPFIDAAKAAIGG